MGWRDGALEVEGGVDVRVDLSGRLLEPATMSTSTSVDTSVTVSSVEFPTSAISTSSVDASVTMPCSSADFSGVSSSAPAGDFFPSAVALASPSIGLGSAPLTSSSAAGVPSLGVEARLFLSSSSRPSPATASSAFASSIA